MCMTRYTLAHKIIRFNPFKDITVYKVMRRRDPDSPEIYSAHRDFKSQLGDVQYSRFDTDNNGDITVGLHSFPNIKDAKRELAALRSKEFMYSALLEGETQFGLYKCIIPKGSRYYRGYWTYHMPAMRIDNIVSSSLIIQEQIFDEDELAVIEANQIRKELSRQRNEEYNKALRDVDKDSYYSYTGLSSSSIREYLQGKSATVPEIIKHYRENLNKKLQLTPAIPPTAENNAMSPTVHMTIGMD